ncbi:zinc ribbon domain-containing protein [Sorangium sp. So ce363]|uniref:zinc ribbon domain-containing protein n=1 Tax=Sorangium sp. So ce363 TaxID=3133304 RepID=UPI003F5EEC09
MSASMDVASATTSATGPCCARCQGPLEPGDLRCAVCGLAAPQGRAPAPQAVQVLRCTECGAAVSYSAEAQAPKCRFCGAVTRIEQPVDPIDQADWLLPFGVPPDQADQALRRWMSTLGFFRPSDLSRAATVEGLRPIWWAGWLVSADAVVSWTADSNAGARLSSWAPHAGQTQLPFRNLLLSASRGLSLDEARELAPYFRLDRAVPAAHRTEQQLGPPDAVLEQFDAQRSAARKIVSERIAASAEDALTRGVIPGSTFRNVHVAVLLHALETRRLALPSYVLAYRYKGRSYRAVVHGQDASHVTGTAPIAWGKVALVVAGALALLVLVIGALVLARAA